MDALTLLIALIALGIAIAAFKRTGGMKDLKHQVEGFGLTSETARQKTADALDRLEQLIRGKEKPGTEKEERPEEPSKPK
ncbi:hypothetical protein MELA_02867 [Candidatus Methylomirabilis lanthanidiphila]|uniref:Uncharacterized protein n=1 Tax=Candidatus Methylomirabilis lanthanidiphila TaxID=2211376 RepID=A0A564ZMB7_9BACT|nr:hypothetical protein [Candidatus Methylomirabilis lanthanidiphila]VUZ86464.1 hypothetical protein MELA_02867 [Candidatus Methylomirabilis lanthanidiphila]